MTVAEYQQAQNDIAEIKAQIAQLRDVVAKGVPAVRGVYGMDEPAATPPAVEPQPTPQIMSVHEQVGTPNVNPFQDNFTPNTNTLSMQEIAGQVAPQIDQPLPERIARGAMNVPIGMAAMAEQATSDPAGFAKGTGEYLATWARRLNPNPLSSDALLARAEWGQQFVTDPVGSTLDAAGVAGTALGLPALGGKIKGFKSIKEARAAINDIGKPKVDVPEVVQEPIRSETPVEQPTSAAEVVGKAKDAPEIPVVERVKKGWVPYEWDTPGEPLITSVGRKNGFPSFSKTDPDVKGIAGFFTKDDAVANRFTKISKHGVVGEFDITIGKKLEIDAGGKKAGEIQFGESGQEFRDAVRSNKYDTIVIKNTADEGDVFVALKSDNIKIIKHGIEQNPYLLEKYGKPATATEVVAKANPNAVTQGVKQLTPDELTAAQAKLREKFKPMDEAIDNGAGKISTEPTPPVTTPDAGATPAQSINTAEAVVKKAGDVEPPPVKTETPTPKAEEPPKSVGLNKAEIETIRKDTGIDELPEADREAHLSVLGRAKEGGADRKALDIAREVKDSPRPITAEEHAGMVLKTRDLIAERKQTIADISNAIESGSDPSIIEATLKRIDDEIDLLTESSDLGGRESARSLNIRRMRLLMESDDIVYHRQEAQAIKGSKLTPEESARLEKIVAEKDAAIKRLDEENARWQKDYEELQAKQAEALIKHEANRAKITERIQGKREKIQAERVDILKKLKERGFETKLNAGLDPQDAYLIGKLGMNYVKGGINNIDQVVSLVMADIPNLTRRDVLQSLNAKNPELQAKAKAQTMIQINHIKRQAELLVKIEDAEKGIFTKSEKSTGATTPMEIKALQAKLRELRSQSYKTIRDADRLERVQKTITSIQDQLANHYRKITKKPVDTPEIVAAKQQLAELRKQMVLQDKPAKVRIQKQIDEVQSQIDGQYRNIKKQHAPEPEDVTSLRNSLKDLRRRMKIEDELARLEDQVRTGDYEVPNEITPRPKSEQLDRLEIDLKRARRVIRDEMEKLRPKSTGEKFLRTSENLRAIKATADLSATLRQGAISVVSHPIKAMQNFVPSLKATFSQYRAEQIDMAMRSSDAQYLRDKAKLELTNIDGTPTTREEHFAGVWIEKIPALGEVVKASNRHMATFLNLMRTSIFDDFVKKVPNATTEELQAYARWINVTTGRGELGKYAQAGRSLGTVFFAPRFAISRIQTPYVFYKSLKSSPRVRAQVAREAAAVGATAMGVLALAKLSGAEVGADPRTSDFGKIRIGNERIDIFAGYQQPMRLIVQAGTAITDRTGLTGQNLREQDKDFDPIDAWMQFAEFKLSPMFTTPTEVIFGKDRLGGDVKVTDALINSVEPMLVNSIREAWKDDGLGAAVRSGGLNLFGVSSNVYADSENRLRRDIAEAEKKGDLETRNRKKQELKDLEREKKIKKRESASR